jgi:hypothetical protein
LADLGVQLFDLPLAISLGVPAGARLKARAAFSRSCLFQA